MRSDAEWLATWPYQGCQANVLPGRPARYSRGWYFPHSSQALQRQEKEEPN